MATSPAAPAAASPDGAHAAGPPPGWRSALRCGWIISPGWDLIWFVATPLLIWPLVMLARAAWSDEQIWLVALAFFSFGHHLPGFLRAYGERELFARFRLRFLVVPPLLFATCLAFEAWQLSGLRLIVLAWATWHGWMQTYGFLRIYALKAGDRRAWSARLDFWVCSSVFIAGVVASDGRMFNLLLAMVQSGLPLPSAIVLDGLRYSVLFATAAVLFVYAVYMVRSARQGEAIGWNKLLLVVTTAGIWWATGGFGTNLLVGVAMFEIFHAVQYLAIVWVYNRRLTERIGQQAGSMAILFRRHRLLLACYLGLIAGFGALRFLLIDWQSPQVAALASAVLATSTLLHYYFDGFIWKVRESATQANLNLDAKTTEKLRLFPNAAGAHVAKWGLFFVPAAVLVLAQVRLSPSERTAHQDAVAAALAAWCQGSAEAQQQFAEVASRQDRISEAMPAAKRAVELRPDWPRGWATLGNVALQAGDLAGAISSYERAIQAEPSNAEYLYNWAGSLAEAGRYAEAAEAYRRALAIRPDFAAARQDAGSNFGLWAKATAAEGQISAAIDLAKQGLALRPEWAQLALQVGLWQAQEKKYTAALESLDAALKIDPSLAAAHLARAEIHCQDAVFWARMGNWERVEVAWRAGFASLSIAESKGATIPGGLRAAYRQLEKELQTRSTRGI